MGSDKKNQIMIAAIYQVAVWPGFSNCHFIQSCKQSSKADLIIFTYKQNN
jgi:hypothetical protein